MVELNMTSFKEYNSLLHLQKYNNEQLLKLAQYPYESLVSLCENVSFYERNKIKEIEAYDISNTSGDENVASMTVFYDGRPLRSNYRKFKIKGLSLY